MRGRLGCPAVVAMLVPACLLDVGRSAAVPVDPWEIGSWLSAAAVTIATARFSPHAPGRSAGRSARAQAQRSIREHRTHVALLAAARCGRAGKNGLAQLHTASPGVGIARSRNMGVAQLVERRSPKPVAAGSTTAAHASTHQPKTRNQLQENIFYVCETRMRSHGASEAGQRLHLVPGLRRPDGRRRLTRAPRTDHTRQAPRR